MGLTVNTKKKLKQLVTAKIIYSHISELHIILWLYAIYVFLNFVTIPSIVNVFPVPVWP